MKPLGSVPLRVILAVVLLALGQLPARAQAVLLPPAVDPVCATVSANGAGTKVNSAEGWVTAEGTWSVAGGAVGALIDYRIDNDRWFSETRPGAGGAWNLRIRFNDCGLFRLRIYVFPTVEAGGRQVHCLDKVSSSYLDFENFCGPEIKVTGCDWECEEDPEPHCTGTCSGNARGGNPPYAVFRGLNNQGYEMTTTESQGPWTVPVACAPGEKVSFKVRDQGGIGGFSRPAEILCGAR